MDSLSDNLLSSSTIILIQYHIFNPASISVVRLPEACQSRDAIPIIRVQKTHFRLAQGLQIRRVLHKIPPRGMATEQLKWCIEIGDNNGFDAALSSIQDVNKEFVHGRMPVHVAADFGQTKMLEKLIARGADVNVVDKHGMTPLMAAVYEGHDECVEVLLKHNAIICDAPDGSKLINCTDSEKIKRLLLQ